MSQSPLNQRHPVLIFLSSTTASLLSTAITNPLQIRKLNQQFIPLTCPQYPNKCTTSPTGSHLIECLCNPDFYRTKVFNGLSVVLPQVLVSNITFMQLYEYQKKRYMEYEWMEKHYEVATVCAATSSRAVASLITSGFEDRRVKMGNLSHANKMGVQEKLASLRATLSRDITFSAIYWISVEFFRNWMSGGTEYRKLARTNTEIFVDNAMPGLFGGVISSFLTNPIDTVKTRVQTQGRKYTSLAAQLRKIYVKQGMSGWFLGWKLRIMKAGTHSTLYLVLFEYFIKLLNTNFRPQFQMH